MYAPIIQDKARQLLITFISLCSSARSNRLKIYDAKNKGKKHNIILPSYENQ